MLLFLVTTLLGLGVYFTITNSLFITKVVMPCIGHLLEAEFTAEYAEYDPFSSYLKLYGTRLGYKDNPFLSIKNATGYIKLLPLLKKTLEFNDVNIDGMDLNFVRSKRDTWSLPWLYTPPRSKGRRKRGPGPGVSLDFSNINISNLNVAFRDESGRNPVSIELNNLDLNADRFKNGLLSPAKYKGRINIKSGEILNIDGGNVKGEVAVNLDPHCIPSHVSITSTIADIAGNIGSSKVKDRKMTFNANVMRKNNNRHLYDIVFLNVKDFAGTAEESTLDTDGLLTFFPLKLSLNIQADPIYSPVLQAANSLLGNCQIGNARLSFLGNLSLSLDGITSEGDLFFSDVSFALEDDHIPLALSVKYGFNLDFKQKTVSLKELNSTLSMDNKNVVSSNLNTPFVFNYKKGQLLPTEVAPVTKIKIRDLDLKLLNVFMVKEISFFTGNLNSDLFLSINPRTNGFSFKGDTKVKDLSFDIYGFKPIDLSKEQKLNYDIKNDINFKFAEQNRLNINNFKITFKQPKHDIESVFLLESPFSFELKENKFSPDSNIEIRLDIDKFYITDLAEYIPKGFPLKLNDGYLRYDYLFTIPKTLDSLSLRGKAELLYSNFSFCGKPINDLSVSNDINAVFLDPNTLELEDCTTEMYINGVMGLLAKTNGKLTFRGGGDSALEISVEKINKYFFDLFINRVSKNIDDLQADGKIAFTYNDSENLASIVGDFNMPRAIFDNKTETVSPEQPNYSGNLKFNVLETEDELKLDRFNVSLDKQKEEIVNLDINGSFPVPIKQGKVKAKHYLGQHSI